MEARPGAGPFLKWAGGKTQLLGPIAARLPARIEGRYFEPFLGSGAVYFHLWSEGRLGGGALLSDANRPLVETFLAVRDRVGEVIRLLEAHRAAHRRSPREHYYAVRAAEPRGAAARAARWIYLNKTCFNGLWRVNRAGRFNVPMGRYPVPSIPRAEALRAASRALGDAEVRCLPFEEALRLPRRGDRVYLDPPYAPVSATARFTSYTAGGFGPREQEALADACARLARRGVRFLLSNSDTRSLRSLYCARGFRVDSVPARRAINSVPSRRGEVRELLVSPQ